MKIDWQKFVFIFVISVALNLVWALAASYLFEALEWQTLMAWGTVGSLITSLFLSRRKS